MLVSSYSTEFTVMGAVEDLWPFSADSTGADLLDLLRDTRRWMIRRTESFQFLDSVSLRRKSTFELDLPQSDVRAPVPLLWVRKSSWPAHSPADGLDLGQFLSRHNFTDLNLQDGDGHRLRLISGREAERLIFEACWHLGSELLSDKIDPKGTMGNPEQERLAQELYNVIIAPVPLAWETLRRHLVQVAGQENGRSELLTQLLNFPFFHRLCYDCALASPLIVDRRQRYGGQMWILSYNASQLWQRRTLKASIGLEPIGIEFDIPRIGSAQCFSTEFERPEGCEIMGAEVRYTSAQPNHSSLFVKKAPRRTLRRIGHELITSRNTRWRSQDRTRFGQRLQASVLDCEPYSQGATTLWLSFERRSIRPSLWAVGIIAATLAILVWHLRALGGPVHMSDGGLWGWRWGVLGDDASALEKYKNLIGPSSSAAVTALIAPGAFASFLVRPSEHTILSQFLRVTRGLVLTCAVVLGLAGLFIALSVTMQAFANLLMVGSIIVMFLLVLMALSYRNCERLPARPSIYGRYLVARRMRLNRWADKWLKSHTTPEDESWWQGRRRMKARRWASRIIGPDAPISSGDSIAMVDRVVEELTATLERSTKEPRRLPFGILDDNAIYRVRLNRVDGMEVPSYAPSSHNTPRRSDEVSISAAAYKCY
jgi:hypothetical protein